MELRAAIELPLPRLAEIFAAGFEAYFVPVSAEVGVPAPAVPGAPATMVPVSEMIPDEGGGPPMIPGWMKDAKTQGAAQAQTLKTVGSLVQENPKQAALIVRDWLSSAV